MSCESVSRANVGSLRCPHDGCVSHESMLELHPGNRQPWVFLRMGRGPPSHSTLEALSWTHSNRPQKIEVDPFSIRRPSRDWWVRAMAVFDVDWFLEGWFVSDPVAPSTGQGQGEGSTPGSLFSREGPWILPPTRRVDWHVARTRIMANIQRSFSREMQRICPLPRSDRRALVSVLESTLVGTVDRTGPMHTAFIPRTGWIDQQETTGRRNSSGIHLLHGDFRTTLRISEERSVQDQSSCCGARFAAVQCPPCHVHNPNIRA